MVEFKARQQFLPSRRGMTIFAALLEGAFVRIDMTINAGLELHVLVACRSAGLTWFVALFAGDLDVEAGQRVASLGMVKLLCCFAICEVVARLAFITELALVRILVAREAVL